MYDLHVHSAPDVVRRRADDLDTAAVYAKAGYRGFVLKSHYEPTTGRAAAAAKASGLDVIGGVALNSAVGGINPAAVYTALSAGGRIVWLPTQDSHTQAAAGLPRLCQHDARLSSAQLALPPLDWSTEAPLRAILAMIAEADAVLATGHVSAAEIAWLLPVARRLGVRRVLLTHPTFTVPAIPVPQAADLAGQGVYVEITAYQLLHQPGCSARMLAELVKAVPADRLVLSSDAGQPDSPPPPDALAELTDRLTGEGADRAVLTAALTDNPERLLRH
ncbi:DUF6282 family protein [Phytohabitans kaempferiae]|uniref:DUF6282 family protein n=1 Tax=Phytohabitans kaempferiae TaxID=1620943 RepID=A0ABV6M3D3_9ACTN